MGPASVVLALAAVCAASDWSWHDTISPHFVVSHQLALMPGGFTMGLERLHGRLRLDLAAFSPWMSKERLKLFLYKDRRSYVEGQFKPPPWSNGLSLYEQRTVAVYDQPDRRKLLDVIAHETTHILFESYWGERGQTAPAWLNEGLAMVEESEPGHPESSEWFRAMALLPENGHIRVADFIKINPTADLEDDKPRVETWYVQAYSMVYFLLRRHTRLQFKSFCALLREGKDIDQALWLVYRYRGVAQLEKAWLGWLRELFGSRSKQRRPIGPQPRQAHERQR